MTEIKDNQRKVERKVENNLNQKEKEKELKNKDSSCSCKRRKLLKLCAWILLAVGLFIIVTSFYMVTIQSVNSPHFEITAKEVFDSNNLLNANQSAGDTISDFVLLGSRENDENSNITERPNFITKNMTEIANNCQENLCTIACENVNNIFRTLHNAIKNSLCPSIGTLLLERQEFPFGVLRNFWLPFNVSINEVIIRFSNIDVITNNAFNSPLFKNTMVLSLSHLNIVNVRSSALLGLYHLKYLTIQGRIQNFEPAILQPVQATLINLKFNAYLQINADKNPFGLNHFNNLIDLDLSHNILKGSLRKEFFKSTPNLKYLTITNSELQHIEENAFENLIDKLLFVNLANNLLTNLAASVFRPMLFSRRVAMINLAKNKWICNCQLEGLAELFKSYHLQFIDVLYCSSPPDLYGVSLAIVDLRHENCMLPKARISRQSNTKAQTLVTEPAKFYGKATTALKGDDIESNTYVLKLLCVERQSNILGQDDDKGHLELAVKNDFFELNLMPDNCSAILRTDNYHKYFVIWFSEKSKTLSKYNDTMLTMDYECMRFSAPELIVGPLKDNTTYTFCLLPLFDSEVTPFNCLPLHVPAKMNDNIWISEDRKSFTIGMLCFIFLLSTVAGALIAYFGIKMYPDLLEGSKNVVIINKADEARYVTTISGNHRQEHSSLKRRKSAISQQNLNKLPLPETPTQDVSPIPFCMSVNGLNSSSSLKSSSSSFEDKITVCCFVGDGYETPKECNNDNVVEQRTVHTENFSISGSPPPLPKRNSHHC